MSLMSNLPKQRLTPRHRGVTRPAKAEIAPDRGVGERAAEARIEDNEDVDHIDKAAKR
jgi:hypothetical protein